MPRGVPLLVGVGLLFAAHFAGESAGAAKNAAADPEALMYLPEGKILRALSLGHRNLFADFVWLQAIQYYGEERLTTRNYDQAERLFRVIFELDPTFKGATRFGALVLAQDAGEPDAAISLLEDAERFDTVSWEYAFDRGFIHQTVRRDFGAAGAAYRHASQLPDAPDLMARLSGLSYDRLGDRETSREVWESFAQEADNEMMRAVAARNLHNLDMQDAMELLEEATEQFVAARGVAPRLWEDLVQVGLIKRVPDEPWGGSFLYDPMSKKVWATTHLDRLMAKNRDGLQHIVREIHEREGFCPPSIDNMIDRGFLKEPPLNVLGYTITYDPATCAVSWNPPWPLTEERNGGPSPL